MKRLGISNQIIIASIFPAIIMSIILSAHYINNQFDYISNSLINNGELIAKQLSPAAEYAIYSGNVEIIRPLIDTILKNDNVLRIQILDKYNNKILDVSKHNNPKSKDDIYIKNLLLEEKQLEFIEPVITALVPVEDEKQSSKQSKKLNNGNKIGKVIVTLTNYYAIEEQIEHIKQSILITLIIVLFTTLTIIKISNNITQPIKSLTRAVRKITAGDLDSHISLNSAGVRLP